ncbi:MAG: stage III sporulation protein AF [Clostridiales bacterium]|jgi:hypothetical protein|nr:stage III sporulation protein AF [Clostridiales bacterium]
MYLIFITLAEILLPQSRYAKYIRIVLGMALVFIVIKPVATLTGLELDELTAGLETRLAPERAGGSSALQTPGVFDLASYEYQREELVREAAETQIKRQIAALLVTEPITVEEARLIYNEETAAPEALALTLTEKVETARTLIRIEPPDSGGTAGDSPDQQESEEIKKIKNIVSEFYNLSLDNIYIIIRKKDGG